MFQKAKRISYLFLCAVFLAGFSTYAKAAPERPLKIDFVTTFNKGTPQDKGFYQDC